MAAWVCRSIGLVLLGLGIWGFTAQGPYLFFDANPVHHIVQVVAGAAALWAGWSEERAAHSFAMGSALLFGAVALMGFMDVAGLVDLLSLNRADHWLHLLIGGASLAGAMVSGSRLSPGRNTDRVYGTPVAGQSPGM